MKRFDPFDVHVERTKKILRKSIEAKPGGMGGWFSQIRFFKTPSSFKNLSSIEHSGKQMQREFDTAKEMLRCTHICREKDLRLGPPGSAKAVGYRNWPYYSEAILHMIEEARSLPTMRCMSCSTPTPKTKLFGKLLVCESCLALATKSQEEIFNKIESAKVAASNWLENHILSGGLLKGSDGIPSTGLPLHVQTALQKLQGPKAATDGGVPVRSGKHTAR